jgi:predicted AAA+ superfamily ATPase
MTDYYYHPEAAEKIDELEDRIGALEVALREVIIDYDDYNRINNLAPSPGKTECWQSVAQARAVLDKDASE